MALWDAIGNIKELMRALKTVFAGASPRLNYADVQTLSPLGLRMA